MTVTHEQPTNAQLMCEIKDVKRTVGEIDQMLRGNGTEGNPGLNARVVGLERAEASRQKHLFAIWAGIFTAIIVAAGKWIFGNGGGS